MTKRKKMTKAERGARWVERRQREARFYDRVAQPPVVVYHGPRPTAVPGPAQPPRK